MNSKQKGARGEREWAAFCREQGFSECRRGQQYNGLEGEDVVGLPYIHQEVKRVEKLNIDNAMIQSFRDAGGNIAIVAHRKNHGDWMITMLACEWFQLFKEWYSSKELESGGRGNERD